MEQIVSFLFKYRAAVFARSRFGFGARPSVILFVLVVLAIALVAYYLYSRRSLHLSASSRGLLIGLRCSLIVIILFCLMRPVIVVPSVIPQSSFAAVLMDDSASMLISDQGGRPRIDAEKELMSADSPFYKALSEKFKVRAFRFSNTAEPAQDAGELEGAGQQTNLAAALEQAVRELAGLPLSGIVMISDGAQTADSDVAATISNLRGRGIPVFTVGLGNTTLAGDLELVRATAPRRLLAGSTATAELLIRASGVREKSVKIDLTEDSHPLRSQVVPLQGGDATEVVRVSFRPSSPGLHRYTVSAAPIEGEPVKENNSQELVIEVEDARPKILYVEGEPRWEFGKLRGAMADEKNVLLVSLLRSADGKFYRQGVQTGDELTTGFPKSEEELFRYDGIIIGSVEATFFTFDQLRAIEQFVSRRGGSMLALGGAKSFTAGGYGNTPLADLLPVYLTGQPQASGESQTYKAALSERGRDHVVARLHDSPEANSRAWDQMPPITLPEILPDTKPGATVILEARSLQDRNRSVPLLVEERYGRGRTLALLASDTWRWRMMLESRNKSFETFWRNTLRYMVESVRRQVEAQTERTAYTTGEQARIRVEVADKKYMPVGDAEVVARVTTPTGRLVTLQMGPAFDAGFEGYSASLGLDEGGLYRAEITARRGSDFIGVAKTSFLAGASNREAFGAAQNRDLLRRIAAETGGGYYTAQQANNLIEDMTHTESGNSVRVSLDLWDMPINFLLVVGLAAAEWFMRKRKGLA